MRLLRIVPDDTKFDFMRFRRISFPMSALLSILAISLYFFHGLNFGIDFVGGTLMEVQSKSGPADLAKMRTTLGGLGLGDVQLQQFGGPTDVLIRVAQQPGGDAAQQAAVQKVRGALGSDGRLPPRRGGRAARLQRAAGLRHARPDARDLRHPDLSLVPVRMAVRARRHDRQRARHRAHHRLHVGDADRFRSHQHRGAAHHPRLFAQRHGGDLRPHPRDAAPLQAAVDAGPAQHLGQFDAVALDHHPRHGDAGAAGACCCSAARRSTASPPP